MKKIRNGTALLGIALTGIGLMASGCGGRSLPIAKPEAAEEDIFADVSASTAFINSPVYSEGVVKVAGATVLQQQLGDVINLFPFGSRTADRAGETLSIRTGYKVRLPVARRQVEANLKQLFDTARGIGGDSSTNLLFTLNHANITCTPRSKLVILSDGIEASDSYNAAAALEKGKPVHLPAPGTPFLKGCLVTFIGIGVSPHGAGHNAETLPEAQLQALTIGWREWFQAAGVQPSDMSFTSIL